MYIAGNMGEWSEVYVLLKLLGDRKVFAGDRDLNKVESLFYNILKIIREENPVTIEFVLPENTGDVNLVNPKTKEITITISSAEFLKQATVLFEAMKERKASKEEKKGSFTVEAIEEFLKKISCDHIKASSRAKADIRIVLHDSITGIAQQLGFSIKSTMGSPATLLNAGKSTRFRYRLSKSLSDSEVKKINGITSKRPVHDRYCEIKKSSKLVFDKVCEQVFHDNLTMIDTKMPELMGLLLLERYNLEKTSLRKLTESISNKNPFGYNSKSSSPFYEFKLKQFLVAVALGMVPKTPWLGKYDATGGYLVVKKNGDILCYHIYNRNLFEDYLFERTCLEEASSSRHDFGTIKSDSKGQYFDLALQIRMKK